MGKDISLLVARNLVLSQFEIVNKRPDLRNCFCGNDFFIARFSRGNLNVENPL